VILSTLSASDLVRQVATNGLTLRCGPFVVRIRSDIPTIAEGLRILYADYDIAGEEEFADIRLCLSRRGRIGGSQVMVDFDGEQPFAPLPLAHAWPCFEWALNWSIASRANYYLVFHAAVLEREGRALLMPGPPGSGKSTLCAALTARNWRLLSYELTLVDLEARAVVPIPRPISLKNQSIQIIRSYIPDAVLGRTAHYTAKGSVSHLKPRPEHVRRGEETAAPGWIVFPKYTPGAATRFERHSRPDAVLELGNNSFNYHILGRVGFDVTADIVEASECHDLEYGNLDEAVATIEVMAGKLP
jgi:HprK-related kinase A